MFFEVIQKINTFKRAKGIVDISIPLLTSEGGVTIGKKDMGTKNLMNYPDVFADIGNVNLFSGKTVLHPGDL